VIDHQHAVEVIELVLHGDGEEAFGFELEGLAVAVLGADAHRGGALDLLGHAGEREAALGADRRAAAHDDLRVDEDAQIARLVLGGDVDDEDAMGLADLRRGEADAGRGVHGLGHVVDELLEGRSHRGDGLRFVAEPRVGVVEDLANHGDRSKP
jgi:hypothetical protein